MDAGELEDQVVLLRRDLRNMEEDSKSYRKEIAQELLKQGQTIELLEKEAKELEFDTKLAGSEKNQKSDDANTRALADLLDEEQQVFSEIQQQEGTLQHGDRRIKDMEKTIREHKKIYGGEMEKEKHLRKHINKNRLMHNQIGQAEIVFSQALADNREVRDSCSHIRLQQRQFEKMRRKLMGACDSQRCKRSELTERIAVMQQSRKEAITRANNIRERNERGLDYHNKMMSDMLRVKDHEDYVKDFMNTKCTDRVEMFKSAKLEEQEKRMRAYISSLQTEVDGFSKIFAELHEVSGKEDIDEMINAFITEEDSNFAKYNYCKEQYMKIRDYEASIGRLATRLEDLSKEEVYISEAHRNLSKEIEATLKSVCAATGQEKYELRSNEQLLSAIVPPMEQVFRNLECNNNAITEMLGGNTMTDDNLVLHLSLVQQRANEIIQAETFERLRQERLKAEMQPKTAIAQFRKATKLVVHVNVAISKEADTVVPPDLGDMLFLEEEDSVESRPLSRVDIRTACSGERRGQN